MTTALAPRTTLQRGHTHSPLKGAVGNKARPVLFLSVAYQRNHRHLVGWIREQYGIDGCSFVQRQITVARDQYLEDVHAALLAHSSAPLCQLHVSYMYPTCIRARILLVAHIYIQCITGGTCRPFELRKRLELGVKRSRSPDVCSGRSPFIP